MNLSHTHDFFTYIGLWRPYNLPEQRHLLRFPADQYHQQALNLAGSNAAIEPAKDKQWSLLGIFDLMAEGQSTPEMVSQLALDKAGAIRGYYYDQVTEAAALVSGSVSKKDQRVAWRVDTNKNLVVETGLYNLTHYQSTALVHFGPDRMQQFVLVRFKQPADEKKTAIERSTRTELNVLQIKVITVRQSS